MIEMKARFLVILLDSIDKEYDKLRKESSH